MTRSILLTLLFGLAWTVSASAQVSVTRYTKPSSEGSLGNCLTPTTRCANKTALDASSAGDIVSMAAGLITAPKIYQGANDMIAPLSGRGGTATAPILVRCEPDANSKGGGCTIDGQFARTPLRLSNSSYWIFEDFNLKSSSTPVIYLTSGNNFNVFRRIVAWDAAINLNQHVVSLITSSNNLFEDFAAFGTGRKVWEPYNGSNNNTCRRCWFRGEGTTNIGPGPTVTPWYLSTGTTFDNVLITASMESMPQTYTSPSNGITYTNQIPGGSMLAPDRIVSASTPKPANATIRGSVSYTKATDNLNAAGTGGIPGGPIPGINMWGASSVTLIDVVRVMAPAHPLFNQRMGMVLTRRPHNCPGLTTPESAGPCTPDAPVTGNTANRVTSIRGEGKCYGANCGDSFGTNGVAGFANETDWLVTGKSVGTSFSAVQTPWQNTSTNGARLCYRWGTTTPLWPWPMNDRILAATDQAGAYAGPCTVNCIGGRATRTATNVTTDLEALLGTIPAACRSDTAPAPFPPAAGYAPGLLTGF